MSANEPQHLPDCGSYSLADMFPGESKPDELTDFQWCEMRVQKCAPDCPRLRVNLDRAIEVARERGWLKGDDWTWEDVAV